jgi:hypothetical protein
MTDLINKITNINYVIVKVGIIDTKNNLLKITQQRIKLNKHNILSLEEQLSLIKNIKKRELPKKYICSCILENNISFLNDNIKNFEFDDIELDIHDIESIENNDITHINTYEHKQLKPIIFKPMPLMLSDLNEVFIMMREISKTQLKTKKRKILLNKVSNTTRKYNKIMT